MHVLIAGAGLGGLALAQCLRQRNISYEIFERDADANSRSQGWAIALHTIINQFIQSVPSDLPDLREFTNHLSPLDIPAQIALYAPGKEGRHGYQDSAETPFIRAERRKLREWLMLNINVKWNKRIAEIEHSDSGVSVTFADGTTAKGDILVGADGINSVVRDHLLGRNSQDLLKQVPIAAIVGEVTLSGPAFERQLALGHSAYMYNDPNAGCFSFSGLHHVESTGKSGRYYWMFMQPDSKVDQADHWLQKATPKEKLDFVHSNVVKMPSHLRELFELTGVDGIWSKMHIWRDLELDHLPASRVILMGDSAHAMTPFRGEGGFHTLIDSMKLADALDRIQKNGNTNVEKVISVYNEEMLKRGGDAVRASRGVQANNKAKSSYSAFVAAARPLPLETITKDPSTGKYVSKTLDPLPKEQTAIIATGRSQLAIQHDVAIPPLEPEMAIVKTGAVALNPSDAKMLDYSPVPGAVHGYDFAGTVVALGAKASAAGTLRIGDRVAGMVHGMNKTRTHVGAFAQYVGADADLLFKIPKHMSMEEGASLGMSTLTAAWALCNELHVMPTVGVKTAAQAKAAAMTDEAAKFVLIAGGSTSTGTRAIEMLKFAGLRPIATCSPRNSDLCYRYGAEKVFDYNSETCAADIREYTKNELAYAFDCVAESETTELCYEAIGRAGGRYVALEPVVKSVTSTRALTVKHSWFLILTVFGRKVDLEGEYGFEARPQDRQSAASAVRAVQPLLDEGLIGTHPVKVMDGGWEGVVKGVDIMRMKGPSGHKLVYAVA